MGATMLLMNRLLLHRIHFGAMTIMKSQNSMHEHMIKNASDTAQPSVFIYHFCCYKLWPPIRKYLTF